MFQGYLMKFLHHATEILFFVMIFFAPFSATDHKQLILLVWACIFRVILMEIKYLDVEKLKLDAWRETLEKSTKSS